MKCGMVFLGCFEFAFHCRRGFIGPTRAGRDGHLRLQEGARDVLQKRHPGEGRILACLYAYGDKLSGRCEYALYDAAVQLERAVAALTYAANECRNDLEKFCANIQPGQGRLAACLGKNDEKMSGRCKHALRDVGLK